MKREQGKDALFFLFCADFDGEIHINEKKSHLEATRTEIHLEYKSMH